MFVAMGCGAYPFAICNPSVVTNSIVLDSPVDRTRVCCRRAQAALRLSIDFDARKIWGILLCRQHVQWKTPGYSFT